MAIHDSLSAVLSESAKNKPPYDGVGWGDLLEQGKEKEFWDDLTRRTWEIYFAFLGEAVEAEAAPPEKAKNKAQKSSSITADQDRRKSLVFLKKRIGHWPTIEDATSQLFVSEVPADIKQFITADLERLKKPVIRRRTSQQIILDELEKLSKKTRR